MGHDCVAGKRRGAGGGGRGRVGGLPVSVDAAAGSSFSSSGGETMSQALSDMQL